MIARTSKLQFFSLKLMIFFFHKAIVSEVLTLIKFVNFGSFPNDGKKKKTISIFKLIFQDTSQTNLKQDQTRYAKFSCPLIYLVPVFAVKCKTKLKPKHEKIGQLCA